jgi:hypothetical protein
VVYAIAGSLNLAVSTVRERGVTPNFHYAKFSDADMAVLMLGHARVSQMNFRVAFPT